MIYKWIFFSSFFVNVWTHITLPTHETIPTFYRLRRNETADRTTALDRSHSKLNSWLGLSGANDSSDVKLVHFLLFVAMDSWNENIVYARRKIRFLVSRRIAKWTLENSNLLKRAMCACAYVCRHPRYPGKCQSTVVKRWIVACARACVRTRDPVLASRKHECEFSLPIRMTKFVPLIASPLLNDI